MTKIVKKTKKEKSKTQPKVDSIPPTRRPQTPEQREFASTGLGPASARCMVIKLSNGEELVALVADGKSHVREFTKDVNAKEKDPKMRKAVMESFNNEISDTLSIKDRKMEDVIVLYYPMVITQGQLLDAKKQVGSIFLQPWVSPSMSTTQIFFLTKEQVVTMFEPTYNIKAYFSNAMSRLIVMITASMTQDAMAQIDPKSELGKLMAKLKQSTKQPQYETQEEQEDAYVEKMITKSREPLKPAESDVTNKQAEETPKVEDQNEEIPVPSVTVGGVKKTLH